MPKPPCLFFIDFFSQILSYVTSAVAYKNCLHEPTLCSNLGWENGSDPYIIYLGIGKSEECCLFLEFEVFWKDSNFYNLSMELQITLCELRTCISVENSIKLFRVRWRSNFKTKHSVVYGYMSKHFHSSWRRHKAIFKSRHLIKTLWKKP